MNFGVQGKSYVIKNGRPLYTDEIMNNPKLGPKEALGKYVPILGAFCSVKGIQSADILFTSSTKGSI